MPIAPCNGIEICYETYGSSDDPVLLLINGLGSQLVRWPDGFRDALTRAGFHLVVFDNRDVGLSTKFADAKELPAYSVDDMANDAAALLEHLGIDAAHIAGMSMGGMIAQVLAIRHPEKVLSLASIMSTTGGRIVPAKPEAMAIFAETPATSREEAIEQDVANRRVICGSGFPFDEDAARELATRAYDRCYAPDGRMRQMLAIRASSDRTEALGRLRIPAVVIHGSDDPLVPVENGRMTADAVPGAKLVTIPGMGHDLPKAAWPAIIDAIVDNSRRAASVN
jgi:pimeloyl-ACP methyl ester carboxylesterase